MKVVSFMIMFIVMLSEAKLTFWKEFPFPYEVIIDYLFPKNPTVIRVRNSEQARGMNNSIILDFIGLIEKHGYPAEEHNVVTEDGYNLKIHRIPGTPLSNGKQKKKVVFIQHGILASSDNWVLFGPGKDLGKCKYDERREYPSFLLADQEYDVWLGNFRGNSYCRSHVKMSPQNSDFWKFSYHELGVKDLPVMIDYILDYTGQKTLNYIGHSMGTTTLFVLLSTRPEYNAKIRLGVCLAPIAIFKRISPVLQSLLNFSSQIIKFFDANRIYDLLPLSSNNIATARVLCADNAITQALCTTIFFLLSGSDPTQLNTTALPEIFSYYPAGCSVQTVIHYAQNMITRDFLTYDYGYLGNYKQFKQLTPMKYDLKKITTPIALFYGNGDVLSTRTNVMELYKQLPNVILLEENPYSFFTHFDFNWAIDAKTLLYDRLIEVIKKFDANYKELNIGFKEYEMDY